MIAWILLAVITALFLAVAVRANRLAAEVVSAKQEIGLLQNTVDERIVAVNASQRALKNALNRMKDAQDCVMYLNGYLRSVTLRDERFREAIAKTIKVLPQGSEVQYRLAPIITEVPNLRFHEPMRLADVALMKTLDIGVEMRVQVDPYELKIGFARREWAADALAREVRRLIMETPAEKFQ